MGDERRSETAELKRSFKLDFSREKNFLRQSGVQQQNCEPNRRRGAMPSRGKPTMEIYRPPTRHPTRSASFHTRSQAHLPGLRIGHLDNYSGYPQPSVSPASSGSDGSTTGYFDKDNYMDRNGYTNCRLNVHAKEFTMKNNNSLQTSKSTGNLAGGNHHRNHHNHHNNNSTSNSSSRNSVHGIQQSKSSGNVLVNSAPLQQSKSSGNILSQGGKGVGTSPPRVHFKLDEDRKSSGDSAKPYKSQAFLQMGNRSSSESGFNLKRSKSLGAADMKPAGIAPEAPDLGNFTAEVKSIIQKAVEDPNKLSARTLMELVRHIFDRLTESMLYSVPAAKLCITIIEKEKNETFLESLINTCQEWYQERDRLLRAQPGGSSSSSIPTHCPRWIAFMYFLNEMYCQLKRRQLQLMTKCDGIPPGLVLLNLLSQCCQVCVQLPSVNSLKETECLFFVLTCIGRDLEKESRMHPLATSIRQAFLMDATVPAIKNTLLQLIELNAARWQLSASAVRYYHPGTHK